LLYADLAKLREAQAVSLGSTLVDWAQRANKLDDLKQRVAARKKNPQSQIPALVLETLAAVAAQQQDAARTSIDQLAQAVEKGALPQLVQTACLAAIPAASVEGLEDPAYKILQIAVRQLSQANANSDREDASLGPLVAMVNKRLAKEPKKVKEFYENYMAARQAQYARYGGDYGLYLQWRDWAGVANEAARAGAASVALDFMGRVTDFQYQNNQRPSLTMALGTVIRELRRRSPQARYDAWRDWTLPTEKRRTVRLIAEWIEPLSAPASLVPAGESEPLKRSEKLLCSVTELLDAAEAAGKLDGLRDKVQIAREEKIKGGCAVDPRPDSRR
jgi:hypothetical protein